MVQPPKRRIAWRMYGDHGAVNIEPQELSAGEYRLLRFEERGIDGLEFEPYTPSDYFAFRWLQFTEYANWNAVAQWAAALFPPAANLQGVFNIQRKVNRKFPLVVSTLPYHARYSLSVKWPEGVGMIRDPSTQRVSSRYFEVEVQRAFRGNTASVNVSFSPRVEVAQPADLPRLPEELRKLDRAVLGVVAVD
jgi:hypothetical protein